MGITSIWNNPNFFTKPVPRWCFEVSFETLENTHSKSKVKADRLKALNNMIESVSFGRRETSIVKTYYAGVEANVPGRCVNTGELNIVFNEDNNLTVTKMLEDIFEDSCSDDHYFNGETGTYTPGTGWKKSAANIWVKILKPKDDSSFETEFYDGVIGDYIFHGCILTSINEEEFSYANTDDILKRTARFSYDYMTREDKFGAVEKSEESEEYADAEA